eukprot:CAMPEP_0114660100 /NCGR_PEP_ID=MMETSP0191-20121206/19303_1 /TAXON_ID=126664 /ORGANISM="Sorites sp." /LENGTH=92 /DNA_ID=CAMNT_0001887571 /DNA_START=38 /DNA_END=319 /DNA_ORIENTATION=-
MAQQATPIHVEPTLDKSVPSIPLPLPTFPGDNTGSLNNGFAPPFVPFRLGQSDITDDDLDRMDGLTSIRISGTNSNNNNNNISNNNSGGGGG